MAQWQRNLPAKSRDAGWISESERSPGEGNGNLLQYSRLENPIDREGWRAIVHEVAKELDMTERLSNNKKAVFLLQQK